METKEDRAKRLNRERVKAFRNKKTSLSGNKITIDYCTPELIENWENLKTKTGLTSAKLLEMLVNSKK